MMTASELIPVRALNQVSYCPRLYYLEYVESVMPTNEYVEDSLFQHRRVNDPALANRTRKDGDILHTRSVSISSERLGISGKLDLMEDWGGVASPVEYKFFEAYEGRKSTVVTHPTYGYKMSYGRILEVQARMLAAYVRGDVPSYTGFTVR